MSRDVLNSVRRCVAWSTICDEAKKSSISRRLNRVTLVRPSAAAQRLSNSSASMTAVCTGDDMAGEHIAKPTIAHRLPAQMAHSASRHGVFIKGQITCSLLFRTAACGLRQVAVKPMNAVITSCAKDLSFDGDLQFVQCFPEPGEGLFDHGAGLAFAFHAQGALVAVVTEHG